VDIPYEADLGLRLQRIQAFISVVLGSPRIERVELFFSQGFDDHYTELDVSLSELAGTTRLKYEEEGRIPSLKLVVRAKT
jgi:hypothetical protein